MHPLGYNDVPTEVHSAPIFNVRRINQKEPPEPLMLSLDQLEKHTIIQKGDGSKEMQGPHQEKAKKLPNSPLSANLPKAQATCDNLPKQCVGAIPNAAQEESSRIVRKSPSCLSVRLRKNAGKKTCHPMENANPLLNKTSSVSLQCPETPKLLQSLVRIPHNVRLMQPHPKLSCISNEMKLAETSSTSPSDDQIVLSTKQTPQPKHFQREDVPRQNELPTAGGLRKRNSKSSVCSHATELAIIIPEISVETNLNCTARSEKQELTHRSTASTSKMKRNKLVDEEEKPICFSQHSIRLRSHDACKQTVNFGRRMRVPRADLSRIRVCEAPGLKALDQPICRPCERKRKVVDEIALSMKTSEVVTINAKSSISYMFLYLSILCGIGLMMIAYYL